MSTSWATAARTVPGLDHDPCPGDVPATHRLATDLGARAHEVSVASAACAGWEHGTWRGDASAAAVAAVARLVDALGPLARSLDGAGDVLRAWAVELAALQDEAAALGAESQETARRQLQASIAAGQALTPMAAEAARSRLEAEREALRRRVDGLHERWLGAARRRSAELDATAPPGCADLWRGAWDLGHDRYQDGIRHQARWLGWAATGTGAASSGAGLVAPLTGLAAPVVAVVSVGLGVASLQATTHLAAGADGSASDAGWSAAGVAGGGVLGTAVRGAARQGPRAVDVVETGAAAHDAYALGSQVQAWRERRGDGETPGTVTGLDGGAVDVTVHDVASPWHVGHGLAGDGFVGVAVVPVGAAATGAGPASGPGRVRSVATRTQAPPRHRSATRPR